jgi:hypothetical protein
MNSQDLIKEIELQRDVMIAVATGNTSIQDENSKYKERREKIKAELTARGIDDPNTFSDLWGWYSKWKESLPSYQSRRVFVNELFDPLLTKVRDHKPFTDYALVLDNIERIEELEVDYKEYRKDLDLMTYLDELYFPRLALLKTHIEYLGFTDLSAGFAGLSFEPGSLLRTREILRGFVIPETRTRVQVLIGVSPPLEPPIPKTEDVIPHSLVIGTRGYIERVAYQINGCYEQGWFDACAVMMRRLIETLIIETFESHKIPEKIRRPTGEYFFLADLISATLNESTWSIGRNARTALPRLKDIGDQSAHSRRFIAQRADIEKVISDFRTVAQELLFLAKLK